MERFLPYSIDEEEQNIKRTIDKIISYYKKLEDYYFNTEADIDAIDEILDACRSYVYASNSFNEVTPQYRYRLLLYHLACEESGFMIDSQKMTDGLKLFKPTRKAGIRKRRRLKD